MITGVYHNTKNENIELQDLHKNMTYEDLLFRIQSIENFCC